MELGGVAELHLLLVVGDGRIDLLEIGGELLDEALARLVDGLRVLIELLLQYFEERNGEHIGGRFGMLLEQCVALFEKRIVLREVLQVGAVVLRDDTIDETATLVAAIGDKFAVLRRDHDQRDETDMVDEALIVFLTTAELLLDATFDAAGDDLRFRVAVEVIGALNHRHVLVVGDVLAINSVVRRLGEAEVVDGVKDIGLALTVETNETIELIRETELRFTDILVIDYG